MRAKTMGLTSMLVLASCVRPLDDDAADDAVVPARVQRVFDENCIGCHDGRTEFSLLADASPAIVRTRSAQRPELLLVELGRVDRSYLATKMLPDAEGRDKDIMPPPPATLASEDLLLVVGWIAGVPLPGGGTDGDATDETGLAIQGCAIEDYDPNGQSPVEAGVGVALIPPDIADVLERNCGCHYVDGPARLLLRIDTWDDFHVERDGDPVHARARVRLQSATAPMPPLSCQLEDGSNISTEDFERLDAWVEASAPDGVDWVPE